MAEVANIFEKLKISAFTKLSQINGDLEGNEQNVTGSLFSQKNKYASFTTGNQIANDKTVDVHGENDVTVQYALEETDNLETEIPARFVLKELELERQQQVKNAINKRVKAVQQFSFEQEKKLNENWIKKQQIFIDKVQKQELQILSTAQQSTANNSKEHEKLAKHYHELAEKRKQQIQELEQQRQKRQIIKSTIMKIRENQQEFNTIYQQILETVRACKDNEVVKNDLQESLRNLNSLRAAIEGIIAKCKSENVCDEDVTQIINVVNELKGLKQNIEASIEASTVKINKNYEESVNKQPEKPQATSTPIAAAVTQKVEETSKEYKKSETIIPNTEDFKEIVKYVNLNNLSLYMDVMNLLEEHKTSFKKLEEDSNLKQFRFDLKKAVNIPVNSLSGVTSEHIVDKYVKLNKLLSGQNVLICDRNINASSHPQGIAFSMDLLASKFVLQGDLMVSSNPESAFCYASVIISLWNDFPIFGKLILAYFYKYCPYLVPYYLPRQVGESDEEFYTKLGYKYTDGQIEKQDKFLKRMTGIARLYFAMMIVKPKKTQQTSPFNLRYAWRWLSSILKLEPRVDITATMVHTFLETVGFEMQARYGKQFQKVINILMKIYFPKCQAKCTGGAVTRLELLLTEYSKNGRFEKPSGYVNYPVW